MNTRLILNHDPILGSSFILVEDMTQFNITPNIEVIVPIYTPDYNNENFSPKTKPIHKEIK